MPHGLLGGKAVRHDAATRTWLLQLEDGKEQTFGPGYQLLFSTKGATAVNLTTYVTRYLQNNHEEAARREKEIAAEISLSEKTVSTYRTRIGRKLGLGTNVELARYAVQHKLVD